MREMEILLWYETVYSVYCALYTVYRYCALCTVTILCTDAAFLVFRILEKTWFVQKQVHFHEAMQNTKV